MAAPFHGAEIQPSFAKGEITPALYGRVDTAAYGVALRTARNVVIRAHGGASNRAGLTWIGPCKKHDQPPRIIQFQFNTTDTYVLELGNLYMRFIRNDGHVTETPLTITGITAANPPVVTSAGHGYSNGDEVFISGVVGMIRVNNRRFLVANVTTNTFSLSDQVTGVAINGSAYPAYVSGGTVARIYTLTTPYAVADTLQLKYVQSADTMTLTHPTYPPMELRRFGNANWTLTVPTFAPSIAAPTQTVVTVGTSGTTTRRYRVTAQAVQTLEESLASLNNAVQTITAITKANPAQVTSAGHGYTTGDEVQIDSVVGMTQLNGRRFIVTVVDANNFTLQGEDSTLYTAYASGGVSTQTFVRVTTSAASANDTISWSAVTNAQKYSVYLEQNGIFGWLGDTDTLSFVNSNMAPNLTISPPNARNPFLGTGNYPGCATYYQQRRVFGGTTSKPDTSYYSQAGSASNMSSSVPSQADDAITATLTSRQVNEIRHFIPGTDLITFTSGSEWQINAGSNTGFSSATIAQNPQSSWGSSHNLPIVVGKTILYVTENQITVRSLKFSWQVNGYTGDEVSLMSSHLFEDYTIVDWTFSHAPDPVAHVVRSDGQVCAMTYNEEQSMLAWTHWDTNGYFERVCSLRHPATEVDEPVYFVVRRTINGNTVRYIERTHTRRFKDVRDCFFVDAGISYNLPITITGVSLANPCVVTAPSHGLTTGQTVDIFDIVWVSNMDASFNATQPLLADGSPQLNNRRFLVTVVDANNISLTDPYSGSAIDASAYNAYVSGGTVRLCVTTVFGLDHLEGQTVAVLADGNVITGLSVLNGAITLPRMFSRVQIGLQFIADIETLNVETAGQTDQGMLKRFTKATIRFQDSRGLLIGPTCNLLTEMKQRDQEQMGDPTSLLTGDKEIILDSAWDTNGRIFMRQPYPLPMTILAVVGDLDVGS